MEQVSSAGQRPTSSIEGVSTNLSPEEFAEVMQAVRDERVVWDLSKAVFLPFACAGEFASGEFVHKGQRYRFTESWESPTTLMQIRET
ncbi:MAG: hypothetical protein IT405_02050 [Candidatus Yanofskybacteria bacterium]|nr:hypothetical protein [Candidatus Yanofskybacteria bacterium]